MSESVCILHDEELYPYGIFTDESELIYKYDNFNKRIKRFTKEDLEVSKIEYFDTFNVDGVQKVICSYGDYVNKVRNQSIKATHDNIQNNILIFVFDFDEITNKPRIIGVFKNVDNLIEQYKIFSEKANIDLDVLQFHAIKTPLNEYRAGGFITLTTCGGMLDRMEDDELKELFNSKVG
ncbi:hypothetical protein ACWEX2_13625 [Staphylococcus xylosus]|uniref:Uncharacterized protein n=1 Tax=Staphylococcus xylosus TaxID=1288 RepID=A0AAQ0LVS1_STAXY|nr:hypothetical protein [Staphylococcus xylosus]RIM90664.1 hypothetical protein BU104_13655 [Staphylococcus xylosus]